MQHYIDNINIHYQKCYILNHLSLVLQFRIHKSNYITLHT